MMLLQVGQLGLSRRDSIWTDELPPDMVAGTTMWIDFTDPDAVFDTVEFDGPPVTTNGASVASVRDVLNHARGLSAQGGGLPPTLTVGGTPSGQNYVTYAGTGAGDSVHYYYHAGGVTPPASTLVTTTTKLLIAAVRLDRSLSYTGAAYDAPAIVGDNNSYFGMYVSDDGGVLTLRAYNWSSGAAEAVRTLPRNEWSVVTMSHQSGQLRCRVNGGSWATTPSGTTSDMGSLYTRSRGATLPTQMDMAHLVAVNTAQTDAAISAVEHWIANDLGIAPWW